MSGLLIAGLLIVGVVAGLNLVLTLSVIRRLRSLDAGDPDAGGRSLPEPGFRPGAFAVADQDGTTCTQADLAQGSHTVVVLTPSCEPCLDMARQLESDVDTRAADTLVWIAADAAEKPTADLSGYRVVHSPSAVVTEVFEVRGFPAVLSIVDGVVAEADHRLRVAVG